MESAPSRPAIVVVGAGAIGSLFAGLLARSGVSVLVLDVDRAKVDRIQTEGIELSGLSGPDLVSVPATTDPASASGADFYFICVKAYDTAAAVAALVSIASPQSLFVSLQNGLGNDAILRDLVGRDRTILGTVGLGAYLAGPGHVVHAGSGPIRLGMLDDRPSQGSDRLDPLARLATLLGQAGLDVEVTATIREAIWRKLLGNVAINPLTALLRVQNGTLLEIAETRALIETIVAEALAVAQADGVPLDASTSLAEVIDLARRTGANRSSMLMDVLAGRRTEVAQLNGAVADLADRLGVAAPVNRAISLLVSALGSRGALDQQTIEKDPKRDK
ncbi:MAG: 2-dehydropantoate 2-reductase [Deltaproteobacteria bacterium]|nr:2-dehydropantoate 2-reductase [Deltaproteobacteria bacterium]